ncbi:imidazole glycerol phosphate synthase subunit HisH [Devosia aurantiaca]|uniref:imidazole glycerol phosphate synthase subunit HisH n=1 Tax=Devosia aurantiaca TaxID=2714858 RepID=UPI001F3BD8EE|nr:imidazole glycerol phosphate synthase subunit HisH [Devosia aurantiaca]
MSIVAIIDYGAGNLRSAAKAFERVASDLGQGHVIEVTADPERVLKADRVMLPGVGAFADCKAGLDAVPGMVEALDEKVIRGGAPVPGRLRRHAIAGKRRPRKGSDARPLLDPRSREKIKPNDPSLKIPHMGWNTITFTKPHALMDGIQDGPDGLHAYFVHSYHLATDRSDDLVATTNYGGDFTACVGRDNIFGTQFHPEKSQALGLKLIENFLGWTP